MVPFSNTKWVDDFPLPLAVFRVEDQVVVHANQAGLKLFGFTPQNVGVTSLWDIVQEVDWDLIVKEKSRSMEGFGEVEIPSSGVLTFRRSDGTSFTARFLVKDIVDDDGVVRLRGAILLESFLAPDATNTLSGLTTLSTRNYFSEIAGSAANEINNSLTILIECIKKLELNAGKDADLVNRAVQRLGTVGSELLSFGEKSGIKAGQMEGQLGSSGVASGKRASVLIVDDEPDLLDVIGSLVRSAGHFVAVASDGRTARDLSEVTQFDFALIDIQLQDEIGLDLATGLLRGFPSMKIVMMSGFSRHAEKVRLDGQFQFLRKPFAVFELLEAIERSIRDE